MKKTLLAAALWTLAPGLALAAITGSKHDLSSTNTTATVRSVAGAGGTNQICVFCHAPHNALRTPLLWNRATTAATTYGGWGITNTTVGTPLPTTIGDVSRRCFSCHDGSIAVGAVANLGGAPATITLTGPATEIDATGHIPDTSFYSVRPSNMQGHHPVSIPYAAPAAGTNQYNGITSLARQGPGRYVPVQTGAACTGSPTGICTTAAAVGPSIQLYPSAAGGTTNYGLECSSCHDTHNGTPGNGFLLRASAAGSALCFGCHDK